MIITDPMDPTMSAPTAKPTPTPVIDAHEASQPMPKRALRKARDHLSNWQELYVWMPIVLFAVLFFRSWVSRLDPNAGVDGLGALSDYAMLGVQFVLTAAGAFILKRTYFSFMKRARLRELQANVVNGDHMSWRLLCIDRLEWLPCLLLAYFVFAS